jgi:hypothetical protein
MRAREGGVPDGQMAGGVAGGVEEGEGCVGEGVVVAGCVGDADVFGGLGGGEEGGAGVVRPDGDASAAERLKPGDVVVVVVGEQHAGDLVAVGGERGEGFLEAVLFVGVGAAGVNDGEFVGPQDKAVGVGGGGEGGRAQGEPAQAGGGFVEHIRSARLRWWRS